MTTHSPQECIPGGGWAIRSFDRGAIDSIPGRSTPLEVNRAVISRQGTTQVVYYWFEQRGHQFTNDHMVKLFLLWDAMTRNRTDGALVRLVTPILPDEAQGAADARLVDFVRATYAHIAAHVPP